MGREPEETELDLADEVRKLKEALRIHQDAIRRLEDDVAELKKVSGGVKPQGTVEVQKTGWPANDQTI